jgi:hypothetical protein
VRGCTGFVRACTRLVGACTGFAGSCTKADKFFYLHLKSEAETYSSPFLLLSFKCKGSKGRQQLDFW